MTESDRIEYNNSLRQEFELKYEIIHLRDKNKKLRKIIAESIILVFLLVTFLLISLII